MLALYVCLAIAGAFLAAAGVGRIVAHVRMERFQRAFFERTDDRA